MKPVVLAVLGGTFGLGALCGAASAATIGDLRYDAIANGISPFTADLGGVAPAIADATLSANDYNGAATLPAGLPASYHVTIDRTFVGDGNPTTRDPIVDRFLFTIDPATIDYDYAHGWFHLDILLSPGVRMDVNRSAFTLFETDAAGNKGAPAPTGNRFTGFDFQLMHVNVGQAYLLQVIGNLPNTGQRENAGAYELTFDLVSPVPAPPPIALLLTGLASLAGLRRASRRSSSATRAMP